MEYGCGHAVCSKCVYVCNNAVEWKDPLLMGCSKIAGRCDIGYKPGLIPSQREGFRVHKE